MNIFRKIWHVLLSVLAVVLVLDAVAFFTIVFAPASDIGKWLAQYEPVFRTLQGTDLKSKPKGFQPYEPGPDSRRIVYVDGPTEVSVPAGHPIFAEPNIKSDLIGQTTSAGRLVSKEERNGWLLIESGGRDGWIHPFVGPQTIAPPPGRSSGQSSPGSRLRDEGESTTDDRIADATDPDGLDIEIRFEADEGRRPDVVYFEHLGQQRRPVLFDELFSEYDPSDLAALPPGTDPARLQEATQLLGENPQQRKVGDFILRYKDFDWANQAEGVLSSLRNNYTSVFREIISPDSREYTAYVFLLPDMESYQQFYDQAMTGMVRTAGHYEGGLLAVHPDVRLTDTRMTIVHEAVHHYNHVLLQLNAHTRLTWLDEGLANYFGLSWINRDGTLQLGRIGRSRGQAFGDRGMFRSASPRVRVQMLQRQLRQGKRVRLREVMALTGDAFYEGNIMWNYNTAWMVVHFLLEGEGGAYRQAFLEFIRTARSQAVTYETLLAGIGMDLKEFNNRLRGHILSR